MADRADETELPGRDAVFFCESQQFAARVVTVMPPEMRDDSARSRRGTGNKNNFAGVSVPANNYGQRYARSL